VRTLITGLTTRAIAESAVGAGFDVVTVDYFGDLDQARLCPNVSLRQRGLAYSARGLLDAAASVRADAVVYVGGLENHPDVVAQLGRDRQLLGNPPETLSRVRDPAVLFPFLARRGVDTPRTFSSRALAGQGPPVGGRWLVKPAAGGGGQGIRAWRGEPLGPRRILQERIAGTPASFSFVADGQASVLLGWSEQLLGRGGFRYGGNLVPLDAPPRLWPELEAMASALTAEFALVGLNGVDFVLRDGRPVVLEVNPRYSASMELVEQAVGTSLFGLHAAACQGDLGPARRIAAPRTAGSGVWGKWIVYAPATLEITASSSWIERGVRDVPRPGDVIRKGQPICTVLASASSREICRARLGEEAAALLDECVWRPDRHGAPSSP
jgi:hypothetical protein